MKFLMEHESKEILERYGIKTARCIFVEDEDEALRAARSIGFPVVLKVASRKIYHKSEVGGVLLDLRSEEEVRDAFRRLMEIDGAEGVNVQPMLRRGIEVIVGVAEDEQFGSFVMFGLGGIFVEAIGDVSFRLLPIERRDAEEMVREVRGSRILFGHRGIGADVGSLVELLLRVGDIAERESVVEMDLNPVFAYEDGCVVADARIVVGERRKFEYQLPDLKKYFYPRNVAVIGASRTIGKPGFNIVWNLKQHGFSGKIFPVNPNAERILDLKCYRSVKDIPCEVDLAIIAVPAKLVPSVMEDCAKKGVKGVIIVSSGFSEEGETGAKYEREVIKIAKSNNIRIFGPNTTGVLNTDNNLISSFALLPTIKKGNIGIIAQTGLFLGILMGMIATNHPSLGFSKVVGLGNKIDIDDFEILNFLIQDEKTKVIGMYIEGIRNGRAFYEVAGRSRKPIIVFKSGRTEFGKKAAISHTASMCGQDQIFNAMCKQANLIRVFSFEEMLNVARALSLQPLPKGNRVAIVHYTGSGCVQGADAAYLSELELADLDDSTIRKIRSVTPEWHQINNPIDIWPMVEYYGVYKSYDTVIESLINDKTVDSLVIALWASRISDMTYQPDFKKFKKSEKPIYFVIEGFRDRVFELKNEYEANGFPVYPDIITAIKTLGYVTNYSLKKERH